MRLRYGPVLGRAHDGEAPFALALCRISVPLFFDSQGACEPGSP